MPIQAVAVMPIQRGGQHMSRPTRATVAGRVYLDLQARARREQRPTDELLVLYVLERFLFRLSQSRHRDRLVLKGGMLLAVFGDRRPTRDIDLLAQETSNDVEAVARLVRDVLVVSVDDGVVFKHDRLTADVIRGEEVYPGVRVAVPASIHRAQIRLRIDVSVGDPVTPGVIEVAYPSLLAEPFPVAGYSLETVLAEKIVTMIDRGDTTTRERDFADVVLLTARNTVDAPQLSSAIAATAAYRHSVLQLLRETLVDLGALRQTDWARFVDRAGLQPAVPASYTEAIGLIVDFADPILAGTVTSGAWDPNTRAWIE
jgi:predicted nucleotidyltransferase component of viral defense system